MNSKRIGLISGTGIGLAALGYGTYSLTRLLFRHSKTIVKLR